MYTKKNEVLSADNLIACKEEALGVIADCPLFKSEIKKDDIEKLRCCSEEFLIDLANQLLDFGLLLLSFPLAKLK